MIALPLSIAAMLGPPCQDAAALVALHRAADDALVAGRYTQAEAVFSQALARDPENATLAYGLACAAARAGELDDALIWLERAAEWGYVDPDVALWDADLATLRSSKRFVEAVEVMERARSERAPHGAWRLIVMGELVSTRLARQDSAGRVIAVPMETTNTLRLLDAETGAVRRDLGEHDAPVRGHAFSPDGASVVTLDALGTWRCFDVERGELLVSARAAEVEEPLNRASIDWVADGERVITSFAAHTWLWTTSGTPVAELDRPPRARGQTWSPGARFVALAGDAGLHLFDACTGAQLDAGPELEGTIHGLAISADGALLAVGQGRGRIAVFDTSTWRELWSGTATDPWTNKPVDPSGDELCVPTLCFSPDGKWLASCTVTSYFVHLHNARTGELAWRSDHLGGRMGGEMHVACSDRFVHGEWGAHRWEIASGERRAPLISGRARGPVDAVAGGRTLISNCVGELVWFDPLRERVLYQRAELPSGEYVLHHPSGWFAGSVTDVGQLRQERGDREYREYPETRGLPARLFDPKRVRAGQTGVALTPAPG